MVAVIAVGNLKGGTGKSTLAVNLAAALAGRSRVLLLDADTQGTASSWAEQGGLPMPVQALPLDSEREAERWAARVRAADADLVVIDCPPHLDAATAAAFAVADLVVIPVTASGADLIATARAVELLHGARQARRGGKPAALLVPSRIDRRTAAGREVEAALRPFGEPIGPAIGQRSAHVDAFTVGQWVGAFAPRSTAAEEIAAFAAAVRRKLP